MTINGILNVDKPIGSTSLDIVRLVRRLARQKRVGHAGTLDPRATGVLPICLGQATRIVPFLEESPKTYRAEAELGITTDTYDSEGKITSEADPASISREKLEVALASFTGPILQTPPMYSAIKYQGKRLYDLARAGVWVERQGRRVQVFRLELLEWQPPCFVVEVECSKGTYIRSLVHDLGQSLNCGAYLKSLARLRNGPFALDDALNITQLEDSFRYGFWEDLLYPVDAVLEHWAAAIVGQENERLIINGGYLEFHTAGSTGENRCRAYSASGDFLAVLRLAPETGLWHPEKVFPGNR